MYKLIALVLVLIAATLSYFDVALIGKEKTSISNHSTNVSKDWVKFVPFTNKFKIDLPKTPKYVTDVVTEPDTNTKRWYELYASEEVDGTIFLVNLISFETELPQNEEADFLRKSVNEIVARNKKNKVLELKEGNFQNRKALFFYIENESIHAKGVTFLNDKTIYQLTYTSLTDNFNEDEYEAFINSFQLIKDN